MPLPNFLIVGAAKAGTTSIADYLSENPNVHMSVPKEPRYFAHESLLSVSSRDPLSGYFGMPWQSDQDSYEALFESDSGVALRGEASVHYLFHHAQVIPKIQDTLDDPAIVIVLREPVARAISNWAYIGPERLSFEEALREESARIELGYNSFWFYESLGYYTSQVAAYLSAFSRVHIQIAEELYRTPRSSLARLCEFLNIEMHSTVLPHSNSRVLLRPTGNQRIRPSTRLADSRAVRQLYSFDRTRNMVRVLGVRSRRETVLDETRDALGSRYAEDVSALEDLIRRDLSKWWRRRENRNGGE